MLKLSVIIVSYNTKKLLQECLRSLTKKTKQLKYEIIVVDNASTDDSVPMVKKLSRKFPIRLIKNKKNLGFGAANNQGIKKARGEFILFLNSDTKIRNNVLLEATNWMQNRSDIGVISCALEDRKGELQGTGGYFPTLLRVFFWMTFIDDIPFSDLVIKPFHPYHKQSPLYKGAHNLKREEEKDWVSGTFFLARRKTLDQVGYFDRDYFMYTEEVDLCFRIKEAGWKIYYLPRWSIIHLGGASSIYEFPIISEYKGVKTFFRKHKPAWQYPILRMLLKAGAILRMLTFGVIKGREELDVYAKAYQVA